MTTEEMQPPALSPVKAARLEKLLDVAEGLFVRQGFRAVTMEALAEAAGMSKATVYGYLRDKDAAFHGVAERLARRLGEAVRAAVTQPGQLPDRIRNGLVAKEMVVSQVVRSSPFAAELFTTKDRIVGDMFKRLDQDIESLLAAALIEAGHDADAANSTARLLFSASLGIANRAENLNAAIGDITKLVDAILGFRPTRPPPLAKR